MENIKNLNNWQLFIDGNLFVSVARSEIGEFIFMLDDYIEKRWRHTPMAENGRLIQSTQWCIKKGQKMYEFAIENYLNVIYVYTKDGDIAQSRFAPDKHDDREKRLIRWTELKDSGVFIGDDPFRAFGRKEREKLYSYRCIGGVFHNIMYPVNTDYRRGVIFDEVQSANKYCSNSKVLSTLLYFKEKYEDYEKRCSYVSGPYQVAKISKNGLEYFVSFNSSMMWHFIKWADQNCYTVNSIFDVYFNNTDACDNAVRYLNKGEKPPVDYRGF
jgi:hypothetical protein